MEKPFPQALSILTTITGAAIMVGSLLGVILVLMLPQAVGEAMAMILTSLSFVGFLLA